MNTNETETYEIPEEWDVSIQEAYRRGWKEGIEMMLKVAKKRDPWKTGLDEEAERLKEQGK